MFFYAPRVWGDILIKDSQISVIYIKKESKKIVGNLIKSVKVTPPTLHIEGIPVVAGEYEYKNIVGSCSPLSETCNGWNLSSKITYDSDEELEKAFESIKEQISSGKNIIVIP